VSDLQVLAARTNDSLGEECHWCRREAPCECLHTEQDGGELFEPITGTWGWSQYPERCMCTCGGCLG
jgi:hypothetical protein